ncbi:MAG: extracellular solute-binding protein, partial [Tepidiformaceae bacterium]
RSLLGAAARNRWLVAIGALWLVGFIALVATIAPPPVVVTHWANGHMMDRTTLLPAFAEQFNGEHHETRSGSRIEVRLIRANSGEIAGELSSRVSYGSAIDREKADPTIVTPAADHWVVDLNYSLGRQVLDAASVETVATTYIGIVTSREIAECLGWPVREIGFAEIVELASDARGWSSYPCAKPEWGREALLAFTYPSRSSTARSVLYTLYSIAAGKPAEELTVADVTRPDVLRYVRRFQSAVDCYVPDTLDLNSKILASPSCAQFFFIAEDNLVKLYQGKLSVPVGSAAVRKTLERDLVMIYPKEGAIIHNHSAFVVKGDIVSERQTEAAKLWITFLRDEAQQRAFMQEGFRRTSPGPCLDPLGSPFSPCASTPQRPIYPDRIDPAVADTILRAWE